MIDREQYAPGPARGAEVRELRDSPEKVWQALTDPTEIPSGASPGVKPTRIGAWPRLTTEYTKQFGIEPTR